MRKLLYSSLIIAGLCTALIAHSAQYQYAQAPALGIDDAEAATDLFMQSQWTGAQARIDNLTEHAAEIEDSMLHRATARPATDRLFNSLLFQLQRYAAQRKSPENAAMTANQVAALLIDFAYPSSHDPRAQAAWLGYLGREVELLAQVPDDYGLLGRRIAELQATWREIKGGPLAKRHPKASSQLARTVAALSSRPDNPQVERDGASIAGLAARLTTAG